jgi:hypothetical protein
MQSDTSTDISIKILIFQPNIKRNVVTINLICFAILIPSQGLLIDQSHVFRNRFVRLFRLAGAAAD